MIGIVSAAVIVSVAPGFAQDKPDFSGTWTYDAEHSSKTTRGGRRGADGSITPIDVPQPPSPALGKEFTAKQDAKALTLGLSVTQQTGVFQNVNGVRTDNNTVAGTVAYSTVYSLDGSESHNKTPPAIVGRPETESQSTAAWNGSTLIVTTTVVPSNPTAPKPSSTTRSFHLDADGNLLVETTATMVGGPWTYVTAYTRKK
ncbi:MAG TPA: hypothetical protein VJN96_12915 [Vicinamibacterales bacterium]|nr:hypothetical protein [Vicinamibacterales bacterium]